MGGWFSSPDPAPPASCTPPQFSMDGADACPNGWDYHEKCNGKWHATTGSFSCTATAATAGWQAVYNGDCRDPATGMSGPNPAGWCGHPHAAAGMRCWLPYIIDTTGADAGCTPAAKDTLGQFDESGEYAFSIGGATIRLGLRDPYSNSMSTEDSIVPSFTVKQQAPIGTLALGGGIGAAAVVGGFFKLKKNGKKRAPSAKNLELSQATAV